MEVFVMDKNQKRALVEECRASGMTAKQWCETKGISYRSYVDWAYRINKENRSTPGDVMQWADVTPVASKDSFGEIRLCYGKWTISIGDGFNPTLLKDVLLLVDDLC